MKQYEEMANDVFKRIDEYNIEKKRRKATVIKVGVPLICLCLAAFGAFGIRKGMQMPTVTSTEAELSTYTNKLSANNEKDITKNQHTVSAPNSDNSELTSTVDTDSTTAADRKWAFNINKVSAAANASPAYYDPKLHYTKIWSEKDVAEYIGADLTNLGDNITYSGDGKFKMIYKNDGTLVYDVISFNYRFGGGSVAVSASKLLSPYDCIYIMESEEKTIFKLHDGSLVNMVVGQYEDTFFADFEYNGIKYRIETNGCNDNVTVVRNILELL